MASKKPRVSTTLESSGDRISSLTDDILSRILSFLPTKDSIRTRVLSSRWKYLFSLVPVLDFRYVSSTIDSSSTSNHIPNPDRTLEFLDFVNWVFSSYNVENMESFRFILSETCPENSRLLSWISESIRRGVKVLHLNVSFHEPQKLPCGIFTCKTLTFLFIQGGIDSNFILDVPEDVCLPHLKILLLFSICFSDVGSFRRFFRSCPVLDMLFLSYCRSGDTQIWDISVPSLKTLIITHVPEDKLDLVLDLPNVKNFTYLGTVREHPSYSFQGFKLLEKACIGFGTFSSEGFKAHEKLVSMVCNAQSLELCRCTLETYKRSGGSLPKFSNLTHLEIGDISCHDSGFILDLLDMTPQLKVLVLDNHCVFAKDYYESMHNIQFSSARVPACVSLNLKEVRFEGFLMLEIEFKWVEFLLGNAKVLDALKIRSSGSLEKQSEINKKLLTFSKCSRICRIVLD